MNNALRDWLILAAPEDARRLAKAAKTSVGQLRHIAHGRRKASAALAQRIAHASQEVRGPRLKQQELCDACAQCPLAARGRA